MNRCNTKGTPHARRNMAELRERKARLATAQAARGWCAHRGIAFDRGWLAHAIAAGYPHATGLTERQKQAWFNHHTK